MAGGIFYLRSQNKNELEILKKQHEKIQLTVKKYLYEMSNVGNAEDKLAEIKNKTEKYKKQIYIIEEKINSIKKFWFLE